MDYKDTLNLPKTAFPMKASLAEQEPKKLAAWEADDLYKRLLDARKDAEPYVLHDGPPYANGHIHLGTALNKTIKDFILKTKNAEGYRVPYVPGWDCHGLPIELKVDKELGDKKHVMTKAQIRKVCRKYADKFIDIQRKDFKRLGVFGDWDNPYITMDFKYESITLAELYKCYKAGVVYRGSKPVYWCHSCETALAEAEVEYADHTSYSVYVKFALPSDTKSKIGVDGDVSAVIWTTTPWTLPANVAIALNTDFDYAVVKITSSENKNLKVGEQIIVANELAESLLATFNAEYDIVKTIKGSEFENLEATHPFYDRVSKLVVADYVTLEAGTGLVHTAPGHGQDDYETGLKYGLEVLSPVDDQGKFVKSLEIFGGMHINDANKEICKHIDENGSLLATNKIKHSYPHCWRCKSPVIFRATPQWFISMSNTGLRDKAIDAIHNKVQWIPSWGKNRILSMVENRPDWCISRQRLWGVPIAFFTCKDCGEIIFNDEIEQKVIKSFEEEGADAWFEHDIEYFLGKDAKCTKCNSSDIKKESDILDVWFDSGTSHAAVCEVHPDIKGTANMYLEGTDQHRGWFQSSLLESVATRGVPPFKEVLTHGFVVDGQGKKQSKSLGNVISPQDIINKNGADILRLWVASEDYTEDIRLSDDILKRLSESYRKIRNNARYMLGNFYDFNPDTDFVNIDDMMELDKNIIARWQTVKTKIYESYKAYQFHKFYHMFLNFCINDLSAFYLDIIKDRVYSSKADSHKRRSAQTAMFILMKEMCIVMSPILVFTADEIWSYLPDFKNKSKYVFEELFPQVLDMQINTKWDTIINVRKDVNKALELAREKKIVGHPLDAEITLAVKDDVKACLTVDEGIEKLFIVSKVNFVDSLTGDDVYTSEDGTVSVSVKASEEEKCARCWIHSDTVGNDSNHPTVCARCAEALS